MKMPNSRGKNTGNNVAKTLKNATKNTMKSQSIHVEICAYVAIKSYGRGTQQYMYIHKFQANFIFYIESMLFAQRRFELAVINIFAKLRQDGPK